MNRLFSFRVLIPATCTVLAAVTLHAQPGEVEPSLVWEVLYRTDELPGVTKSPYLSPTAITVSPDSATLYIAEYTARRVDFVPAVPAAQITRSVYLPKHPNGLAVSPDGSLLYVTCSSDMRPAGMVYVIDTQTGGIVRSFSAGHSARAPVLGSQGDVLYLCNRFKNIVSVFRAGTGVKVAEIPVVREPYAAELTPDGTKLVVANLLPSGPANVDVHQAVVSIIDTRTRVCEANVKLNYGAQSLLDICVSPDGRYAYVPQVRSNFTQTPPQPIMHIQANEFAVVHIREAKLVTAIQLDDGQYEAAANPWAVACNESHVVIVTAGSREVHVIDHAALHEDLPQEGFYMSPDDYVEDRTRSQKFTERVTLGARGGRCAAVVGNRVFVPGYFSDNVQVFAIETERVKSSGFINLFSGDAPPQATTERKGEEYFADATEMCLGEYHSCHTCHPFGRAAGIKWDLENDGLGNFKNDKSLVYAHITPPSMMTGVRPYAEVATRKKIELVHFIDPLSVEEKAQAIDEYLKSLRAVPSPCLVDGRLGEAAQRGKQVFNRLDCAHCHPPDSFFTDMKLHEGETGPDDIGELDGNWDTPTLHEIWRTAPYLHDGRTMALGEVLEYGPMKDALTEQVSAQDISDLVAYLKSL